MSEAFKSRYKVWLKQSKYDLEAAQDSLNNRHYEWTCYQSTQSVEKALKSIIVHAGFWPPQTHKLGVLVGLANKSNKLFANVELNFRKIEAYTFFARYPFVIPGKENTPHEMIDREDAETCLTLARDINQKIEKFTESTQEKLQNQEINIADYYFTVEEIQARINQVLTVLKSSSELNVSKVVLFGGFAREKTRPRTSTIDLLIVADNKMNFVDRIHFVRELTKGGEPIIEPLIYTPEEFDYMVKEEGEGFLESALKEGRVLFEKTPE